MMTEPVPFFHRRWLGDLRPRREHGLGVCERSECRRHFEPTREGQALCQRCTDAAAGIDTSPAEEAAKRRESRTQESQPRQRQRRGLGRMVLIPRV